MEGTFGIISLGMNIEDVGETAQMLLLLLLSKEGILDGWGFNADDPVGYGC
jgi:hypothetical protein